MPERETIVDKERLEYEGPFELSAFYQLLQSTIAELGYGVRERKHSEAVSKEGKLIYLELECRKVLSEDYARALILLNVQLINVKDIVVEGKKYQTGKISIVLDGILETDYEGRWEEKPLLLFLRTLYDKFIFKTITGGYDRIIREDANRLKDIVSAFFNISAFRVPQRASA